jgi:hypothetical protein
MPPLLVGTWGQINHSLLARLINVPKLHNVRPVEYPQKCLDKFITTYIDKTKYEYFTSHFQPNDATYLAKWMEKKQENYLANIEMIHLQKAMISECVYACHVKPIMKPVADDTYNDVVGGGQVITAHNPWVTAKYANMACYL